MSAKKTSNKIIVKKMMVIYVRILVLKISHKNLQMIMQIVLNINLVTFLMKIALLLVRKIKIQLGFLVVMNMKKIMEK